VSHRSQEPPLPPQPHTLIQPSYLLGNHRSVNFLILCAIHHHVPAKNWLDEVPAILERPSVAQPAPARPSPAQPSLDSLLKDEGLQLILLGTSEAPGQVLQRGET
jgi:hypothetical protein